MRIGAEPHHLAIDPEGRRLWVTDNRAGRATLLSAASGRRLRSVETGDRPHHVAVLGGRAVVAVHGTGTVRVYREAGGAIGAVTVGRGPHGIALVSLPS